MRTVILIAALVTAPAAEAPKSNRGIDGDWQVVKLVTNLGGRLGEDVVTHEVKGEFSAAAGKLTFAQPGKKPARHLPAKATYEVDETKGHLDIKTAKGAPMKAVFERDGDALKIAFFLSGDPRPDDCTLASGVALAKVVYVMKKKAK